MKRTALNVKEAALCGMLPAVHARAEPQRLAIAAAAGTRTFDELNANANRIVRLLRARGLAPGDGVALVCSNRAEFAEVFCAVHRGGFRLTPINWHLTPGEMAYIAGDCGARAIVGDARFADEVAEAAADITCAEVRLAVGGAISGFEFFDDAISEHGGDDLDDPTVGGSMLYTSGTTGRPKGVRRPLQPPKVRPSIALIRKIAGYRPGADRALCTGPLYHAAPLAFSLHGPLFGGIGVVLMDGWNATEFLRLVDEHGITHSHMVPTMFHRLLALPEEERGRHDLSTLRMILHGAAPCPVAVKQALMDWLGPIVHEYYAATEGWGSFVTPDVWLERPGTVGLPEEGNIRILDDAGREQPAGQVGTIYLKAPDGDRFTYFNDDDKTSKAYDDTGAYFTLGDMGHVDADGYLFLSDRSADVIISGGVNVYPAEVDAALLTHPAVGDAATIGVPNDEWGEEVRAVVELRDGFSESPELAAELVLHCREHLAHFKCPRSVDFEASLPRYDTGKIYRRLLRDRYWAGREKRI